MQASREDRISQLRSQSPDALKAQAQGTLDEMREAGMLDEKGRYRSPVNDPEKRKYLEGLRRQAQTGEAPWEEEDNGVSAGGIGGGGGLFGPLAGSQQQQWSRDPNSTAAIRNLRQSSANSPTPWNAAPLGTGRSPSRQSRMASPVTSVTPRQPSRRF
jgi:hypothetical protein